MSATLTTMRDLLTGIVTFRERELPRYAERFRALAAGQSPDAFFITCADSRVVPDLVASTEPGDLFAMRNVGNLVPPATATGLSTGDVSEASAIEYAVLVLKVANIVVCGHSGCGAMKAALAGAVGRDTPNLELWLHHAGSATVRLAHEGPLDPGLAPYDQLSQINVLVQLEHLMTYKIVRDRVAAGELQLSGWWFDIATGNMLAYERTGRAFVTIDRAFADRLSSSRATPRPAKATTARRRGR